MSGRTGDVLPEREEMAEESSDESSEQGDDGEVEHQNEDLDGELDQCEEVFVLRLGREGSLSASSQQQAYIFRSVDPTFEGLCLYEFVGVTEKIAKPSSRNNLNDEYRKGRRVKVRDDQS